MWPFGPRNNYPYTDFHELNTDWILAKIRGLEGAVSSFIKNWSSPKAVSSYQDFTDPKLIYLYTGSEIGYNTNHWYYYENGTWNDGGLYGSAEVDEDFSDTSINAVQNKTITKELLPLKVFNTPKMFGASADGTTDDTDAFYAMIQDCESNNIPSFIPDGTYKITDHLFGNIEIMEDNGTYNDLKPAFPRKDFLMCAESNLMHAKILSITSGYTVQAMCYDSNNDYFYVGLSNTDDSAQKILTLNNKLEIIQTTDLAEPALHLNTITYNPDTNELITIRSSGYELLVINLSTGTLTPKVSLTDFNSGIQYDPVLKVYVGINGPAISGTVNWNYRIYDAAFNVIRTGTFQNPYGYTNNETPNGFSCYDGKMVHSSFTTNGVQFGVANRVQFLFGVDYFGNVSKIYQEFLSGMEYEGVAHYNGKYLTANVPYDGILMITLIDPECVFSTSMRTVNQRFEMPITWNSTYVNSFHGHAAVNMQNRTVSFSGYVQLNLDAVPIDEEVVLGTFPDAFAPYGSNYVICGSSGIGTVSLVMVNGEIRYSKRANTSQYINLGGSYIF